MLPDINLLPKYEKQNSFLYILSIVGLVIVLLLLGAMVYFYFTTKSNLEETEQNLTQLNQEKAILGERLATENTEEEDKGTLENAVEFAELHVVPTSNFIDELFELLPEKGYLSNYTYNYQSVEIETQFETMSDAAAYVAELNESAFVRDVIINDISTFELTTGEVEEEVDEEELYKIIPRYNVSYSIDVDQAYLKEEGGSDE